MKKQLGYIEDMLAEQKSYKRAKRKEFFIEIANLSSVILLGAVVAIIFWLGINY